MQLYYTTDLPRKLSVFHCQTITNQTCPFIRVESGLFFSVCSELSAATVWQNQKWYAELWDHLQTCSLDVLFIYINLL